MSFIRPATPGFLVTLVATILLAIVCFSVPYVKSVFFLRASLAVEGLSGNITFGTLGYCLHLSNGTTCTKPHLGYELGTILVVLQLHWHSSSFADINQLVGNNTNINIPQVVVKWVTYALVLHIIALCFAAGSAIFGILAHLSELAGSCLSTCISGFGASVTLLAFIFDLVFFFLAKPASTASMEDTHPWVMPSGLLSQRFSYYFSAGSFTVSAGAASTVVHATVSAVWTTDGSLQTKMRSSCVWLL